MDQLLALLPVLLGGVLAVSGGVVAQLFTHRLAKSRETETLRRQKGEAFVKALYSHMQWIDEKRTIMVMKQEDHDTPAPIDEARMLQRLYFPELAAELKAIQTAYVPMLKFLHAQHIARLKNEAEWFSSNVWDGDQYSSLYQDMHLATETATEKCRQVLYGKADG